MLYPLIFQPILKEHVWGGRSLASLYGKPLPEGRSVGESWEISDRPEGVSVIANGPLAGKDLHWLMEQHGAELMGRAEALAGRFPLLVKILDCHQAPSVQVHPPAEVAARSGGEPKTELWYVTHAEPGARLLVGLRRGVKRAQFERRLGDGTLAGCLHEIPVQAGDAMFVPSGRVHAIGGGTVVIEIQQNSNTTYRVFDWDRVGADGKPRELHVAQAMEAIDFEDTEPDLVRSSFEAREQASGRVLADNAWFSIEERRVSAGSRLTLGPLDRPLIVSVVTGDVTVSSGAGNATVRLGPGQFCLVPACVADAVLEAGGEATYLLAAPTVTADSEAEAAPVAPMGGVVAAVRTHESPRRRLEADAQRKALPSRRAIKHSLSKRLIYSPFLKMLVLLFWFRLVVMIMAGLGLTAAIMLPKIWKVTPPEFRPEIRVSLLDKAQAFMLRRTATRAMAARDFVAAYDAWRGAFGNDMGNPELARGLIRCIMAPELVLDKQLGTGVYACDWLLRLTQTNRAEIELVASFYDKAELHELAGTLLRPYAKELSGKLKTTYVKALFFEADFENYESMWKELSPAEQATPEMSLIQAAYVAGWGRSADVVEARHTLDSMANARGPLWLLANRLLMAISASRMDPDGYLESLKRLKDAQVDNGLDNATYWVLLANTGSKAKAIELARDFAIPPRTASELVQLVRVDISLGLKAEALKLMRAFANSFALSEAVWTTYAALLLEERDWEGLRGAALHMRQFPVFRGTLDALSHYYEGRADLATGREEAARRAFNAATNSDFRTPGQAILAASALLTLNQESGIGYAGHARAILERAERLGTNRVQFLELLGRAATMLKDGPLFLQSSRAAYEIQPKNADYKMRYAAALLIEDTRLDESLTLMRELLDQFPNSAAIRINTALALVANFRAEEADRVLDPVREDRLRLDEVNSYNQAKFEYYLQKREYAHAWSRYDRIDQSQLFPAELKRLETLKAKLPPRPAAPAP